MTDGSSQGLFTIVAVVIFGIFIGVSYIMFQGTMKTSLASIFEDAIEKSKIIANFQDEVIIKVRDANQDQTDVFLKMEKMISKNTGEIGWRILSSSNNNKTFDNTHNRGTDMRTKEPTVNTVKGGSLKLTDTYEGLPILDIGDFSFFLDRYTGDLDLPKHLERIGIGAFRHSEFTDNNLVIPETVTEIRNNAFYVSKFKGKLKLPPKLKRIEGYIFELSEFEEELIIPENVEYIDMFAFKLSRFEGELKLPNKLKHIQHYAFNKSQFSKISAFPDSFKRIGSYAFESTEFKEMNVLDLNNLEFVGKLAFNNSSFTEVIDKNKLHIFDDAYNMGRNDITSIGINYDSIKMKDGSYYK